MTSLVKTLLSRNFCPKCEKNSEQFPLCNTTHSQIVSFRCGVHGISLIGTNVKARFYYYDLKSSTSSPDACQTFLNAYSW